MHRYVVTNVNLISCLRGLGGFQKEIVEVCRDFFSSFGLGRLLGSMRVLFELCKEFGWRWVGVSKSECKGVEFRVYGTYRVLLLDGVRILGCFATCLW